MRECENACECVSVFISKAEIARAYVDISQISFNQLALSFRHLKEIGYNRSGALFDARHCFRPDADKYCR